MAKSVFCCPEKVHQLQQLAIREDPPPGVREARPPAFGLHQVLQIPDPHGVPQERRRVVLCDEEVPTTMDDTNDPEGVKRTFFTQADAGQTKWTKPSRYCNGYELFDTQQRTRRGGDDTITKGHREANDTKRIFFRGR